MHNLWDKLISGQRILTKGCTAGEGRPFPLKTASSNVGIQASTQYMVAWAHLSPQPKQHLGRFSHFSTAHGYAQQTEIEIMEHR